MAKKTSDQERAEFIKAHLMTPEGSWQAACDIAQVVRGEIDGETAKSILVQAMQKAEKAHFQEG